MPRVSEPRSIGMCSAEPSTALQWVAALACSSGRMSITGGRRPLPFTVWVTPPSQAVFEQKSLLPIMCV